MPLHEKMEFNYQTILDNVSLVDADLLLQNNLLIVAAGHKLLKKKEDEALRLKTDSYVLETNVHFPTDLNLLWDSSRKCLDMVENLLEKTPIKGWRKIKDIRKVLKSQFRSTSQKVFKGRDEHQKKQSVKQYLRRALSLKVKVEEVIENPPAVPGEGGLAVAVIIMLLAEYKNYLSKFIDQIERRLLKGEAIPAEEKIYSIFEPHTEWITKGKLNKEDKERENQGWFKKLRKAHSAVESNINMLEHHGLNRCMDKGLHGFKRYAGLSVLAYNLHIPGNALIEKARAEEKRRRRRGLPKAA